jgi:hypothetical protein
MATIRNPLNTIQISDKELAKMTLGFLKSYYKYRERDGDTQVRLDVKSESGIIADGYLTFPLDKKENKNFVATLEATDYWHREELRYHHTRDLLMVDAVTSAFILAVIFLGYFYFKGIISIFHLGLWSSIFTLFIAVALTAGIMLAFLWPNPRYRYIYAIEQFKKYYVDDQWIGFTFDVFPNYQDKYYLELRRQCIRYGIGLIEIDSRKKVKILLAPARQDAIENNRNLIEFKRITALSKTIQQSVSVLPFPIRRNGKGFFAWQADLLRFQRTYNNQIAIISTCLLLIGALIFTELQKAPINYVDEAEYVKKQSNLMQQLEKEQSIGLYYFKIDSGVFVRETEHYMSPYIVYDVEQEPIVLAPVEQSMVATFSGGIFENIPCEQYSRLSEGRYIIFFTSYYKLDEAKKNAITLREANIPANVAWAECFFEDRPFYLVFYDNFFVSPERAEERVRSLAAELKAQQLVYEVGISRMSR